MTAKDKLKGRLQDALPFLCLALVFLVFQVLTGGKMLVTGNIKPFVREAFTILLGACGLAFILSQGAFDFSITAGVAVAAAVGALASNLSLYLILPTTILVGIVIGLINGAIYAYLNVNPFITTLAMSFVLGGVDILILGSGSLSVSFDVLKWDSIPLRIAVMVSVSVVCYILFEKTRIGKEGKLIGDNPEFAQQSGVNVKWVKVRAYLIMGVVVGIVAFFALIRSATASTSTGAGFNSNALNAVLLGGMAITGGATSKFRSAVIGALTMAALTLGMNKCGIEAHNQQLIEGLVFMVAVAMTFDRKNTAVVK